MYLLLNRTVNSELICKLLRKQRCQLTGVKKDSATNLALAFNYSADQYGMRDALQVTYEKLHL